MSKRLLSLTLIVFGIIGFIFSLVADQIGVGAAPGVGWKQLIGAAVGILIAIFGLWLSRARAQAGAKDGKDGPK